jgi:heme-degrading monooxygenase HmoA
MSHSSNLSPQLLTRNHQVIRDQLALPTWLILGAAIQGLAHLTLPYRNIVLVLPCFLFLLYKIGNTALLMTGILPNPLMQDVVPRRTAIVYPNEKGEQSTPGDQDMCAIILGVVSHHPLGMFGPGFKEVGDRFREMVTELSADASRHGFLGASDWLNAGTRTSGNEFMSILYFEDEEALHRYAHGPMHSETMLWWRQNEDKLHQIGIMHEVFAAKRKGWEGVYVNYHRTGKCLHDNFPKGESGMNEWN